MERWARPIEVRSRMICYNAIAAATLVVCFGPLVKCRPAATQINEVKAAEQATECGKSFEFRMGSDKDLTLAAEFAAHVAFQVSIKQESSKIT